MFIEPIFLSLLRLPDIVRNTLRRSPGDASSIEISPVVSGNGSNKSLAGDQPHNWFEPRASVLVAAPQTNFSVLVCIVLLLEPKVAIVAGCLVGALVIDWLPRVGTRAAWADSNALCSSMSFEGCPGCPACDADPSRTGAAGWEGSPRTSVEPSLNASMSMLREVGGWAAFCFWHLRTANAAYSVRASAAA